MAASDRATVTNEAPARAQVVLVGEAGRGDALGAVLTELLVRQSVSPSLERRERFRASALLTENSGDARVWVFVALGTARSGGTRTARLYFRGPYGNRFLLRELTLKNGLDELGRELIAQVVETSTVALLRSEVGISREEAKRDLSLQGEPREDEGEAHPPAPAPTPVAGREPSAVPAPAPERRSSSLRYELAARLAEKWAGPDLGVDSALGLETGVSAGPAGGRSRGLAVRGRLVFEHGMGQAIETASAGADTRTTALRAGIDVVAIFGPHGFAAGASGGADVVRLSPRDAGDMALTPSESATVTIPMIRVDARYELTLGAFRTTAGVFGDVALEDTHYDVRRGDEQSRVAEPWALRPGLSLTVGWAPPL